MAEDRITQILRRWKFLQGEKGPWSQHWEDLARVLQPGRMGFTSQVTEGGRRTDDIYDGTPMQARRGLANSIGGMLRPQGLPETKMKAENEEINELEEAQAWLADSEERLRNSFDNPHSRFRQASGEVDNDLATFGTAIMFIGESISRNRLIFQSLHLKDATIAFDEEQQPESLFHERLWPLRQVAARFGENKLSDQSRKKLQDTPDAKIQVLHIVHPRKEGKKEALMAKSLPIEDLWLEVEAKHELSVGGFHEFPFIVPRWDTSSGEDYGRSPGMIALPDADTLQAMGETILIAGQRAADPPLAVPNDGSFDAVNTFPGGLAYYDIETAIALRGRNPFMPIESGTNLPITRDMQTDTRSQVWAAFFRNVMNLPIGGPKMTATEVIAHKEEFIREMGPIFGRLESDYDAPMNERAFMVQLRAGGFLPIPPILQGQNIKFEFDSPVKRIRQQIEASAARIWAAEMIELGQVKPGAIDLINEDELGRFSAEALGIPKKIVNSQEKVIATREARAQAQAEQSQAIALQQVAELAKTGAQVDESLAKSSAQVVE